MRKMILNADLLSQFPDRFPDLLAARTELQRVIEVKERVFSLPRALMSLGARHEPLHARWMHSECAGGCDGSLMVVTTSPLTSAEVEQEMQLELGELRAQLLVLVMRKALERVAISVRGVPELRLSEEHVAILEEFVQ